MRSLHDGVDTSTSTGRMVAGILMSIAEYERELVRERTALKLEHARKSGRKFGRPAKLTSEQAALAQRMKANGETAATICRNTRHWPHHPVPLPGRERRGRKHFATAKPMKADGHTARDVAKYLGVSRATLYRYLADEAA